MATDSKVCRLDTADSTKPVWHQVCDMKAMVERYKALFKQERFSDIVLRVGDQRYFAHRFILITASSVFEAMLSETRWKEANQPEICLTEEEECVAEFEHFLGYLYSAEAVLSTTSVLPLLLLADKYEVSSLRHSCLRFMMDHVVQSPDTNRALTWYQYAQMTGQSDLRDKCKSFILSNFDTVMRACDWPYMVLTELQSFLASSEMVVHSEATLWSHVEAWLLHDVNKDNLLDNLRDVLPHIRFMMMPPKSLLQVEQSSLYVEHKHLFADKLNMAYRKHSLAMDDGDFVSEGATACNSQETFRNYRSKEYSLGLDFSVPGFVAVNKIDSRIMEDCKIRYRVVSSARQRPEDTNMFSVYFFPRGYFTTLTIYGSYMGRQTNKVTLKVIRKRPDQQPMKVDVTLVLMGKQNGVKYAAFTHSWTTIFSKEKQIMSEDNFLDLEKLLEENSAYLVDGALEGTVFIKIQDMGPHLQEPVKDKK